MKKLSGAAKLSTMAVLMASAATPAYSQILSDEIVVTAQKREQSQLDVGLTMSAFGGDQLDALNIKDSMEIIALDPSVSATGAQSGFLKTYSIRGVTQNDFQPNQESPVAAYADEVYLASITGQTFAVFDTERVEILKGPQGTLFGRNATGGLIHYISRKPTRQFEGYIDVAAGDYGQKRVNAAIGGPLSDTISVRVAGVYDSHDGYLKNIFNAPDQWDKEMYGVRAHILFEPTDDLSILLSMRAGRSETTLNVSNQYLASASIRDANGQQIGGQLLGPNDNFQYIGPNGPQGIGTRPCNGCDYYGWRDPDGSGDKIGTLIIGQPLMGSLPITRSISQSKGITGKLSYDFGNILLESITDFTTYKWQTGQDLGPGNPLNFGTKVDDFDQFSQEIRLSGDIDRLHWIVGGYYLNINMTGVTGFGNLFTIGNSVIDLLNTYQQKTQSYSGFGQVDYKLTETVSAVFGFRAMKEPKRYRYVGVFSDQFGNEYPDQFFKEFNRANCDACSQNETLTSARLGLNWKPNGSTMLYANISKGMKAGGFNVPNFNAPTFSVDRIHFDPETLWSYEAGVKAELLDGDVLATLSGFYYDYRNYQAFGVFGVDTIIFNTDATIKGVDFDVRAQVTENFSVMLAGAYTDSNVQDVPINGTTTLDRESTFLPHWKFSTIVRYEIPTEIGKFAVQYDGSYNSSHFLQLSNYNSLRQSGYILSNLRASFTSSDEAWTVYGDLKNVTDVRYATTGFDVSESWGSLHKAFNEPRRFEIGVKYQF